MKALQLPFKYADDLSFADGGKIQEDRRTPGERRGKVSRKRGKGKCLKGP